MQVDIAYHEAKKGKNFVRVVDHIREIKPVEKS